MKKVILAILLVSICSFVSHAQNNIASQILRSQSDILRDTQSKGFDIVTLSNIKSGMTVLDVFGGGGYYSEILSKVVGAKGKVYLHNNQAYIKFIGNELKERLANNRLKNVIRYDREADALALKAQQFDGIFFILGYHDLYHKSEGWNVDKEKLLAQIVPSLKSGGKLVVVDHSAVEGSKTKFSQTLHRIDKQYVIDELTSYGLHLTIDNNMLANSKDNRMTSPFKPEMRRKTDRFVLVFEK